MGEKQRESIQIHEGKKSPKVPPTDSLIGFKSKTFNFYPGEYSRLFYSQVFCDFRTEETQANEATVIICYPDYRQIPPKQ